jgi:hypothetical protein
MSNFRTSSVFKFTKDFELLKKIIRDGVIPNYCEEDLSFDDTEFIVGIPMASFCDIPIMLLDEHNSRYGNYGVALSKKWAIHNGLTPVMYISNDDILRSVYYYHQQNEKVLEWYNRPDIKQKLLNDTIFRGLPVADYARIIMAHEEHAINTHIIGYLKKYEGYYKGTPINNYEENEWRYLVPDNEGTKWFWSKEDYTKWRNPHGKVNLSEVNKPSPSESLRKFTLKFNINDVSYILIKDDEFKIKLINYIKNLKTLGGNILSSDIKDDLISRIITLEQIKRDF